MNNDLFFEFLNDVCAWFNAYMSLFFERHGLDPAAAPTMK